MAFVRNAWQVAAHAPELGVTPFSRELAGEPVLLYRLSSGAPAALLDRCPHRLVPLSAGTRVGDEIQCGYHGLRFAADGRCRLVPGQTIIPAAANAKTFPLIERYGLVWIWMGDAKLADPSLMPSLPWLDDPGWSNTGGYLNFRCNHQLVTDNLLDLSHESYVHERTIGNASHQSIADYPVDVTVEDRKVLRVHREMPGIDPPPFFAMLLQTSKPIDRWQTAIYAAPGLNMTEAGVYPSGTPRGDAYLSRAMHFITPETEGSTHYFWLFARNYRLGDKVLDAGVVTAIDATFNEDRDILALQQRVLDELGDVPLPGFTLGLDGGPIRGRRLHEQMLLREQEGLAPEPLVPIVSDESATPAMAKVA